MAVKYQAPYRLMHKSRRDKRVFDALKATGHEIKPAILTEVLMQLFKTATPLIKKGRDNGDDLWDILPLVQSEIDWASKVPQAVFFEMFVRLIEARCEWEKNPEYPYYRYDLYNPAVLALIAFRKSVGDHGTVGESWIVTDAVFFNELARGFDIDEDEDEDVVMDGSDCQTKCEYHHAENQDYHLEDEDSYGNDEELQDENQDPTVAVVIPPMVQMKID
ncbi:hypothetical protein F5B22DRAFT_632282 [Xylaria bambusicola]|uniref:uncharacterized protein n=1 Tax=Xylaria bambusicola TaxID=326684 RepID=UPI0020081905|nr:uncharacterized protein F5B22DRAFT_632282 [Xylaria bambusicola]KAI0502721.1 hypothetical protein F5B22DRAFT_632282 [Xylaria bambusicola]